MKNRRRRHRLCDAKYHFAILETITAIHAGDKIGNPAITGDRTFP